MNGHFVNRPIFNYLFSKMMTRYKVQCNCKYECNGIGTDCKVVCNDDCGSELVNEETDTCNNDCPSNSSCKNGVCYCDEGQGSPDHL